MARRLAVLLLLLCAPALAACGSKTPDAASEITGGAVTVYSSLPLSGPLAPVARDVVRAEKLALLDAGGRVGDVAVGYVSLDSADPRTGRTSAERVAANARAAIQDRQTLAYLGELEHGASAVSLPVLNQGGIVQVSPGDTYAELTEEAFAPSGVPTFARVVPADDAQARALAALVRRRGVRRAAVLGERDAASLDLARRTAAALRAAGVTVVRDARRGGAVVYTGARRDRAARLARLPRVRAFGSDALALGGPPPRGMELVALAPPRGPEAEAFARRFAAAFGHAPHPRAILGYEAMRVVLRGMDAAGAGKARRRVVARAALRAVAPPRARFAARAR